MHKYIVYKFSEVLLIRITNAIEAIKSFKYDLILNSFLFRSFYFLLHQKHFLMILKKRNFSIEPAPGRVAISPPPPSNIHRVHFPYRMHFLNNALATAEDFLLAPQPSRPRAMQQLLNGWFLMKPVFTSFFFYLSSAENFHETFTVELN